MRDHCHDICKYRDTVYIIFKVKGIVAAFHNGSNCNYKFIKKELAERNQGQLEC